ncbi:MAG: hypothetical protein GXX96_02095 [Planctomycetaceae bacterium]|nr:hypothetical protein [Planctomycetaceae bacterium]
MSIRIERLYTTREVVAVLELEVAAVTGTVTAGVAAVVVVWALGAAEAVVPMATIAQSAGKMRRRVSMHLTLGPSTSRPKDGMTICWPASKIPARL